MADVLAGPRSAKTSPGCICAARKFMRNPGRIRTPSPVGCNTPEDVSSASQRFTGIMHLGSGRLLSVRLFEAPALEGAVTAENCTFPQHGRPPIPLKPTSHRRQCWRRVAPPVQSAWRQSRMGGGPVPGVHSTDHPNDLTLVERPLCASHFIRHLESGDILVPLLRTSGRHPSTRRSNHSWWLCRGLWWAALEHPLCQHHWSGHSYT